MPVEFGPGTSPSSQANARPLTSAHVPGALGLRGLAAISILAYHVWLYSAPAGRFVLAEPFESVFSYSRVGTAIFMLLSSFLLYVPFATAILTDARPPSVGRFLGRRFLRLAPAYWLILAVVSLVLGAALIREDGELVIGSLVDRPDLFLVNMALLQNFRPETFHTGIGPAWYVSSVVVFYLSLPVLSGLATVLARRWGSFRLRVVAALAPAMALMVVGFGTKLAVLSGAADAGSTPGWDADWSSVVVRSFLGQSDRFAYGMAAAVVWLVIQVRGIRLPRNWWALPMAGMLVVGATSIVLHKREVINDLVLESALAFTLSQLLLTVALQHQLPRVARRGFRLLDGRVITALGLCSYSVFLWHEPIIRWLAANGLTLGGPAGLAANLALIGAVVFALSAVTYYLAERPFISVGRPSAARGAALTQQT